MKLILINLKKTYKVKILIVTFNQCDYSQITQHTFGGFSDPPILHNAFLPLALCPKPPLPLNTFHNLCTAQMSFSGLGLERGHRFDGLQDFALVRGLADHCVMVSGRKKDLMRREQGTVLSV